MPARSAGFSHASVMLWSSKASAGTRTSVGGAGRSAAALALEPPAAASTSEHSAVVAIVLQRISLSLRVSAPVLDEVLLHVAPVDVLAEAGTGRDAHVPLGVHGIDRSPQPWALGLVVELGVQEAALVELARQSHRAQRLQRAGPAAVQLQAHPERLAEVGRLEDGGDPAVLQPGPEDVGGPALDRLRTADRQIEVPAQPRIRRRGALVHGLLHPVEAQLLQRPAQVQRVLAR